MDKQELKKLKELEKLKNSINSLDIMNEERVNYTLPKTLSIKIKSEKSKKSKKSSNNTKIIN